MNYIKSLFNSLVERWKYRNYKCGDKLPDGKDYWCGRCDFCREFDKKCGEFIDAINKLATKSNGAKNPFDNL